MILSMHQLNDQSKDRWIMSFRRRRSSDSHEMVWLWETSLYKDLGRSICIDTERYHRHTVLLSKEARLE
jgi:hypothetical protein